MKGKAANNTESEIESVEDLLDEMSTKYNVLQETIEDQGKDLIEKEGKINRLENEIESKCEEIEHLESKIEELEVALAESYLCDVRAKESNGG